MNQTQIYSITSHLQCLPKRQDPGWGTLFCARKPALSLSRGDPKRTCQAPAAVGKQPSKQRPGPIPTHPGVPSSHPTAPLSAQDSAIPTHSRVLIKSMSGARTVTGTCPPALHRSAFIQVIFQSVTKARALAVLLPAWLGEPRAG